MWRDAPDLTDLSPLEAAKEQENWKADQRKALAAIRVTCGPTAKSVLTCSENEAEKDGGLTVKEASQELKEYFLTESYCSDTFFDLQFSDYKTIEEYNNATLSAYYTLLGLDKSLELPEPYRVQMYLRSLPSPDFDGFKTNLLIKYNTVHETEAFGKISWEETMRLAATWWHWKEREKEMKRRDLAVKSVRYRGVRTQSTESRNHWKARRNKRFKQAWRARDVRR